MVVRRPAASLHPASRTVGSGRRPGGQRRRGGGRHRRHRPAAARTLRPGYTPCGPWTTRRAAGRPGAGLAVAVVGAGFIGAESRLDAARASDDQVTVSRRRRSPLAGRPGPRLGAVVAALARRPTACRMLLRRGGTGLRGRGRVNGVELADGTVVRGRRGRGRHRGRPGGRVAGRVRPRPVGRGDLQRGRRDVGARYLGGRRLLGLVRRPPRPPAPGRALDRLPRSPGCAGCGDAGRRLRSLAGAVLLVRPVRCPIQFAGRRHGDER